MKKVFGIFMVLLALAFVSCSNAAGSDGDDGAGDNSAVSDEASSSEAASGSGTVTINEGEGKTYNDDFSISADGRTMTVDWHNEGEDLEIFARQ